MPDHYPDWTGRTPPKPPKKQINPGCLVAVAVLIGLIIIAIGISAAQNRSGGVSSSTWGYERAKIAGKLNDLQAAQQAGNLQHAAQIREDIIKDCQTDALLGTSTSSDHDAVQRFCGGIGIAVP